MLSRLLYSTGLHVALLTECVPRPLDGVRQQMHRYGTVRMPLRSYGSIEGCITVLSLLVSLLCTKSAIGMRKYKYKTLRNT